VVLATGNAAPEPLRGVAPELRERGAVVEDPWRASLLLRKASPSGTVVLVGSGLTAADVVATLRAGGHRGRILAVSRHGLLPRPHLAVAPAREGGLPRKRSLRRLLAWLRESGDAWRSALDALRPSSSALWQGLTEAERARFLRHLRARWDVHRHRVPPKVNALLRELLVEGKLRVIAGRVAGASATAGRMRVKVRKRSGARMAPVEAELLVNCTGPSAASALGTPLVQGLLEDGLASVDSARTGAEDVRRDAGGRRRARGAAPAGGGAAAARGAVGDHGHPGDPPAGEGARGAGPGAGGDYPGVTRTSGRRTPAFISSPETR